MASPSSLNRSLGFPRVTTFAKLQDAQKWASDLLRALEQQFGNGGSGGGSNVIGTGRFAPGGITQGVNIVEPSAYPYTPTVTDLIVLVDTSAARNIDLPGTSLGFLVTIKDFTGTAGANNISVNAAAGQFIDGAATFTMGTNYQVITILGIGITGSEWVIFAK